MKPDLIRIRTAEGRSRATASGQQMGRPPQLMPEQQGEVRKSGTEGTALKGNCSTPSRTVAMGRILAATAAFERLQVIFTRPNSPVAPILERGLSSYRLTGQKPASYCSPQVSNYVEGACQELRCGSNDVSEGVAIGYDGRMHEARPSHNDTEQIYVG